MRSEPCRKVIPPGARRGRVAVPSSKSIAHRELIAAMLSGVDEPVIRGESRDTEATRRCLKTMMSGGTEWLHAYPPHNGSGEVALGGVEGHLGPCKAAEPAVGIAHGQSGQGAGSIGMVGASVAHRFPGNEGVGVGHSGLQPHNRL